MDTPADQSPSTPDPPGGRGSPGCWSPDPAPPSETDSAGRARRSKGLVLSYRCPVCGRGDHVRLSAGVPRTSVRCPNCTTLLEAMPGPLGAEAASVRVAPVGGLDGRDH